MKNIFNYSKIFKKFYTVVYSKKNESDTKALLSRFKIVQRTNLEPYEKLKRL